MGKIKLLYGLEAAGGGALKHLVYLVTRLDKESFAVTVILSDSRNENITEEIEKMQNTGAKVLLLPMCKNINPGKDLLTLFKLISFLKREKYNILHAHSSKAGGLFRLAAWICKVPFIYYTPHCFYFQGKRGLKKYFFVLLERCLSKLTTRIIVSEGERNEIINNKITRFSKIININNAIDFDEYLQSREIAVTKSALNIPVDTFVVGAIGRLAPQKDWETYIYAANEVLKKHPQVKFLIVGDGEQRVELQKLIFDLNIESKVILTGYIKDIYKIYEIIDVYVNTSLWEGLPYVFLEAMKYQKPIVATDTGNDTTILHGKSGFINPVKDYHSIAQKIIMLVENKQMAIHMGKRGTDWLVKKYSFDLFIEHHDKLYKTNHL